MTSKCNRNSQDQLNTGLGENSGVWALEHIKGGSGYCMWCGLATVRLRLMVCAYIGEATEEVRSSADKRK